MATSGSVQAERDLLETPRSRATAPEGERAPAPQAAHAHEWEVSPWPLVLSVGILFLLPLAFAFYFVYDKPVLAVACLGIGTPLSIAGIAGWIVEGLATKEEQGLAVPAMPWFILAEALIFLSFFAAYWTMRLSAPAWPPAGTVELPTVAPLIMTVILVTSSFTIHAAEGRLMAGQRGPFLRWLLLTMVLGVAFLGFSAFEWTELFHEGFGFHTNVYSTAFFSITGFHAAHVLVGVGIFIAILVPALAGRTSEGFVRAGSMYWHFVDIVWLFVVSQVYFW